MCDLELDEPCKVWNERSVVGRREHACCECDDPIARGAEHVVFEHLSSDGGWGRDRMHAGCRELWWWLNEVVCGGHGTMILGYLGSELAEHHRAGEDGGLTGVAQWMRSEHRKLAEEAVANGK